MCSRVFIVAALAVCAVSTSAWAQAPSPPGLYVADWQEKNDRQADPEAEEFNLINYFFIRATATNMVADPLGLRGVSVGPIGIGGGSTTVIDDENTAHYIEQRWIPILEYSPIFVDGLATFRAQFEIDYTWGLGANFIQNNQGGGFNADQVNIQTKNVNVGLYPTRDPSELSILLGTFSVYDSLYDPTITPLQKLVNTGYKLAFVASDASGVSAHADTPAGLGRAAFVPLQASQPDRTAGNPQLQYNWLMMLDYAWRLQPGTILGVSYYRLADNSKGAADTYTGIVDAGPSSALANYTGTQRFQIDDPSGHVNYLGVNFHHNIDFATSKFGASGYAMYNVGEFVNNREDSQALAQVDINGLAANLELMFNWGKTLGDIITVEGQYASGDDDPLDNEFSSPFTLNYYGLPGAVWFDHKTLLLFPFTQTVNNFTGAVTDLSNQGYGLAAGIATAAWDIIPYTLNLKLGGAFGTAVADPVDLQDDVDRGKRLGTEINAELTWRIRYLMDVGLHAGYLFKGNFYDGNEQVDANPWAAFTTFTWYAF